jgi:NADH:ubiquinone oxidoreductase subunit 6 (subunit J)
MFTNYLLLVFCVLATLCSIMIIVSKNPIHSILYLILVFCNITFVLIILGVEFIAIIFLIVYVGAIAVLFLFVVMMLNIKILELDEVFWKYIPVGLLISSCFLIQVFFFVFNFNISEVINLFFYDGFFYLNKLTLFRESSTPSLTNHLINGIYQNDFDINSFQHLPLNSLYSNSQSYFCFIGTDLFTTNTLVLSSELTNTEVLGWLLYTYTFFVFLVVSLILLVSMIGSIILVLNQNINIKRQLIFRQTLRDLKSSVILKRI